MTLLELIQAGGRRTNKTVGNSDVKTRFIDHVNFARKKAWNRGNWSWKNKVWQFTVSDQIITGTATATNGSRSIVLSSASVSSAQVGWYLQIIGSFPASWYRVLAVSGKTLTIDPAYQGSSISGAGFYLRGFDWPIPSELEGMPTLVELGSEQLSLNTMLVRPAVIPDSRGKPTTGILWSDDPIGTTYTAGTITATIGTRTWTGASTLWLTGANAPLPGDQLEIMVGSVAYKYMVQSVQSETQLTTYQYAQTSPVASGYTLRNQFNRLIRLTPTPDYPYVMAIHGARRLYPLGHDNDIDEFLTYFDESIVEAIEAYEACSSPDQREDAKYNRWLIGLNEKMAVDARNFKVAQPAPIANPYASYRS